MLEFVEELWREFRSGAGSEKRCAHSGAARSPLQGMLPAGANRPAASYPVKLSGISGDDLCNAIWMTAACQTSLADRKAAFEAFVRSNLRIDGFSIFSKSEETAFIDNVRSSSSDQALRELVDIFAGRYRLLDSALLQSVRVNANLI